MRSSPPHIDAVALAASHPRFVLAIASLVMGLAVFALSRVHVDSTLSAIVGGDNPAAEAIARITDDFHTAEDLLVLASAPSSDTVAEAELKLAEYAARLTTESAQPDGVNMGITRVRYQPDDSFEEYFRDVVLPAGMLWLDDPTFRAVVERLQPDQVREQMRQNATLLSAPGTGAGALAKQLVQDPLRLREFFLDRFSQGLARPSRLDLSDDRLSILIRVSGSRPVNDIEFSKRFTADVTELAGRINTDRLDVRIGGGYAVAAITATAIRSDAITSTVGSSILITLFLAAAFRRIVAPLTIALSAGVGVVAAFGGYALIVQSLTPLTAVLAAMLAGLGVDYAIHFRSHYDQLVRTEASSARASVATARTLAPTLLAACVTSLLGFGTVAMSQIRMLQDFAVLGCLGLVGALVSVWVILPALLALLPHRRSPGVARNARQQGESSSPLVSCLARHPRLALVGGCLLLAAAVLGIAATPGFAPPFETDPSVLHPEPNSAIETGVLIREKYRALGETMFVHVVGRSPAELIERSHDVANRLNSPEGRSAGVARTLGLSLLVPDPRLVERRARDLEALNVEAIVAGFENEVRASDFTPQAFEGYADFLRRLLTARDAPSIADVRSHPEIARLVLPAASVDDAAIQPQQAIVLVHTTNTASERSERARTVERVRSLLSDLPGATLTGLVVVSHDFERAARRDLSRFGLLSVTLVVVWLFLLLRRWFDVLMAMIPVIAAFLSIFAAMSVLGERLNPVNIVAFPLLAGIAVDSGIFLVATARGAARDATDLRAAFAPTIHAIVCTSVTTVLGFGTLLWTHTPAVRSLGLAMLVGVGASLAASVLILAPLLLIRSARLGKGSA